MRHERRTVMLVAIAAVVVVALAAAYALGRESSSTHGSMTNMDGMDHTSGTVLQTNGQPYDQAFIDNMAPHHAGAVEMARIELAKGRREDVKRLAARIISEQKAETERMQGWRNEWFGDSSTPPEMSMDMPGMDVGAVRDAEDVDRAFIEMMIPHHESAVAMAIDARIRGEHAEVRALAESIIVDQRREIAELKDLREAPS